MQFDSSYVMLPYRAIAERLGARVSWDSRTRAVTVTKGNDVMRLTVGQKAATVRDRTVTLEAAPLLVSGRVLVPLLPGRRARLSRSLGRLLQANPAFPVRIFWANQGDRGAHVNISGAGITTHAPNRENAIRLLDRAGYR
ncbi:MAG: stalk domain-containing protein [Firmicutes bacterium]|nr:stalk domain-containing protein [Bacillota bacterium]